MSTVMGLGGKLQRRGKGENSHPRREAPRKTTKGFVDRKKKKKKVSKNP